MNIDDILNKARVIPVLDFSGVEKAAPLGAALLRGGLRIIELTMRSADAPRALRAMKDASPELIVGMGTIRSASDIDTALNCGAEFLVTPGASPKLLSALSACGAPALPGVATASEVIGATEAGFSALKFFPAGPAGGVAYLKSLGGPFREVRFCPTGGVNVENARDYLALENVACVGGTWIADAAAVARSDWAKVEANAGAAAKL